MVVNYLRYVIWLIAACLAGAATVAVIAENHNPPLPMVNYAAGMTVMWMWIALMLVGGFMIIDWIWLALLARLGR